MVESDIIKLVKNNLIKITYNELNYVFINFLKMENIFLFLGSFLVFNLFYSVSIKK